MTATTTLKDQLRKLVLLQNSDVEIYRMKTELKERPAEVEALTVLLRALADPQDQLTLVNVLRGPLFGLSDRELFEYKQSGGWFSIFSNSKEGEA